MNLKAIVMVSVFFAAGLITARAQTPPTYYIQGGGSGRISGLGIETWRLSLPASSGGDTISFDTGLRGNGSSLRMWAFSFNPAGVPTIMDAAGTMNSNLNYITANVRGQQRTRCFFFLPYRGTRPIYKGYGDETGSEVSVPFSLARDNRGDIIGYFICDPEMSNGTLLPGYSVNLAGQGMALVQYTGSTTSYDVNHIDYTFFPENSNPIDDAGVFVRDNYEIFLNRPPDLAGLNYWRNQITQCGADTACIHNRRIDVSAAFFVEQELQSTGIFIYLTYRATLGPAPSFSEYQAERSLLGSDTESEKQSFLNGWVQRPAFLQKYPAALNGPQFIDALLANVQQATGVNLSDLRPALLDDYAQFGSRARVLRLMVDNAALRQAEFNKAFVLHQYFGYLQRDADAGGYDFWLNQLNQNPLNYRGMVCAFITCAEYQRRFSNMVTRNNSECR